MLVLTSEQTVVVVVLKMIRVIRHTTQPRERPYTAKAAGQDARRRTPSLEPLPMGLRVPCSRGPKLRYMMAVPELPLPTSSGLPPLACTLE